MNDNKDEIDYIDLLKKIYYKKKLILKISLLSCFFGTIYALSLSNQFTASITFIPQLSSEVKSGSSSLSGLASLAGINLGGIEDSSEIPPTLYPQVVGSVPFMLSLLSASVNINNEETLVREYLSGKFSFDPIGVIKKYTIKLPSLIFGSINDNDKNVISNSSIYNISQEDYLLFNSLSNLLSLSINEKEGFITMSFTDENKNIAAQVAQIAQVLLQERIIEYKVQSSKELLGFTKDQYDKNKSNFEILQDKRALFLDKNINISSSLYQNKLSRIESELNIAESIVQQLATQVEQAKLQVNKDTPVFTIIQPVNTPFLRSNPKRTKIALTFLFLGFVISCGYVIVKKPIENIFNSIKL